MSNLTNQLTHFFFVLVLFCLLLFPSPKEVKALENAKVNLISFYNKACFHFHILKKCFSTSFSFWGGKTQTRSRPSPAASACRTRSPRAARPSPGASARTSRTARARMRWAEERMCVLCVCVRVCVCVLFVE